MEKKYILPGTISSNPETCEQGIYYFLKGLVDNGFKKFVIINGHDENMFSINRALERIMEKNEITVLVFDWWEIAWEEIKEDVDSRYDELGVAGEDETAIIQYLGLIRGKIPENNIPEKKPYQIYKKETEKLEVFGKPQSANAKKGEIILEKICKKIVEVINKEFKNL